MNKAKLLSTILLAGTSLFVSGQTNIPESPAWDVYPDTWVATDGAGRVAAISVFFSNRIPTAFSTLLTPLREHIRKLPHTFRYLRIFLRETRHTFPPGNAGFNNENTTLLPFL